MWLYTAIMFMISTIVVVFLILCNLNNTKYSIWEIIASVGIIICINVLLIDTGYSLGVSEGVKRTYIYNRSGNLKLQEGLVVEIDTLFSKDLHIPLIDKNTKFIIKYYKKGGKKNVEGKANRPKSKNE